MRDFALAVFSAIAGVAIGYVLTGFDAAKLSSWLLLSTLVIGMITSLVLIGPLRLIFSSPGSTNIEGQWFGHWQYKKGNQVVIVKDKILWNQHGQYISGKASSFIVTGPHPTPSVCYKLSGRLTADGILYGQWRSVDQGKRYSGVFQAQVRPSGELIEGAWIGTDSTGVQSGQWKLSRQALYNDNG